MTEPDVLNEADHVPGACLLVRPRPSGVGAHPISPRPVVTDWPATGHDRDAVWERLTSGMFVLDNANSQDRRVRGLAWLLDWLADQPGQTWQQRWMASGADAAGGAWRDLPAALAASARPRVADGGCAALSRALVVAICADLVRPVAELAGGRRRRQGLPDPQPGPHPRPARVRASSRVVRRRSPGVRRRRRPHAAAQRRNPRRQGRHPGRRHRRRRAGIDGPRSRILHLPDTRSQGLLPDAARTRCLRRRRAATLREFRTAGQLTPEELSTATGCSAARSATCSWTICANASRRWTTPV